MQPHKIGVTPVTIKKQVFQINFSGHFSIGKHHWLKAALPGSGARNSSRESFGVSCSVKVG